MGNGMPVSAVVGNKDIMKLFDDIFFTFAFGGKTLSLSAVLVTIKEIKNNEVINFIWKQGEKLKNGINCLIIDKNMEDMLELKGYPVRTVLNSRG